jgi:SAM-dependent methyltransferase
MKLSRKIEKLFSFDVLQSFWEHVCRRTHPLNTQRFLDRLDPAAWRQLGKLYPPRPDAINRFDDAAYWMTINVERAQDLWLDRSPPLRILDLGCGAGYFLYVCQSLGHEGLGLDTPDEPLFHGTTALLNVRRIISRIDPGVPLPDLGEKFDLVTAHRVCFHRTDRLGSNNLKEWTPADWKFFINDIRTRFLKPAGRLLLDFNPRLDGSSFFTPELRACFLTEGARLFRSKALLATYSNRRPRFKQTSKFAT